MFWYHHTITILFCRIDWHSMVDWWNYGVWKCLSWPMRQLVTNQHCNRLSRSWGSFERCHFFLIRPFSMLTLTLAGCVSVVFLCRHRSNKSKIGQQCDCVRSNFTNHLLTLIPSIWNTWFGWWWVGCKKVTSGCGTILFKVISIFSKYLTNGGDYAYHASKHSNNHSNLLE